MRLIEDFYFSSPSRNPLSDVNTIENMRLIKRHNYATHGTVHTVVVLGIPSARDLRVTQLRVSQAAPDEGLCSRTPTSGFVV